MNKYNDGKVYGVEQGMDLRTGLKQPPKLPKKSLPKGSETSTPRNTDGKNDEK